MQDTPLEKLDKKHFAKGSGGPDQNGVAAAPQVTNLKEIALMEAKINKLCELLEEVSTCWLHNQLPSFLHPPSPLSFKINILCFFCDIMQTIARTKDNIVKKQALTYEEIEAEREEVSGFSFEDKLGSKLN